MQSAERVQKLLTKAVENTLPELYSQENVADPIVRAKFFTPWSRWTWYATEFSRIAPDGAPNVFFGWVVGQEAELGYFSLDELESIRGPAGLRVERDTGFSPRPLSVVQADHERAGVAEGLGASLREVSSERDPAIRDAMARTLWVDAWASNEEEWDRSQSGQDVMEIAPPTPEHAHLAARKLYDSIEAASGGTGAIVRALQAAKVDALAHGGHLRAVTKDDFGYALAMEALGTGVAWTDDHPSHGLTVPHTDYYYDAFPEATVLNAVFDALGGKRTVEASEVLEAIDLWREVDTDELAERIGDVERGEPYEDDAKDIESLKIAHAARLAAEQEGIDLDEGRRRR